MKKTKKTKKAKLYKMVYRGKIYTGYNKDILIDYIISLKLK